MLLQENSSFEGKKSNARLKALLKLRINTAVVDCNNNSYRDREPDNWSIKANHGDSPLRKNSNVKETKRIKFQKN